MHKASLEKQVHDAHSSLAVALARIEVQRIRLKILTQENVHLRNALRNHGINPGEAASADIDADENSAGDGGSETQHEEPQIIADAEEPVLDFAGSIISGGVQVPAQIAVSEEGIKFFAVAADIRPDDYLGLQFFSSPASLHKAGLPYGCVNKPSWWGSLFSQNEKEVQSPLHGSPRASADLRRVSLPPRPAAAAWTSTPITRNTPDSPDPVSAPPDKPPPTASIIGFPPTLKSKRTSSTSPQQTTPTSSTISEGLAAGLQEGLASISQLTGYFGGNPLKRTSMRTSARADPVPETAVSNASEQRQPTEERLTSGDEPGWEKVGASKDRESQGLWQIMWRTDGILRAMAFRSTNDAHMRVQEMVEAWKEKRRATNEPHVPHDAIAATDKTMVSPKVVRKAGGCDLREPEHLAPSKDFTPSAAAASTIITLDEASALSAAIPGRRRISDWSLLYSSEANGFSLQTVYRAGAKCTRSLLIIEDFSGFVFGAFCTDLLKVNPRYVGTGECFVFQLRPHPVKYGWHRREGKGSPRNDFFMLVGHDSLGIGGAPHFAVWLDTDLLHGNSGLCHTFSSPVLSGTEDFKIKSLELWKVGS